MWVGRGQGGVREGLGRVQGGFRESLVFFWRKVLRRKGGCVFLGNIILGEVVIPGEYSFVVGYLERWFDGEGVRWKLW